MKNLEKLIDETKKWSEKNLISIFNGFIDKDNNPTEIIVNEDLKTFLQLGLKNEINHIILSKDLFDHETELRSELNDEKAKDEALENKIISIIKQYEVYDDTVFFFKLAWVKDGVIYTYTDVAEWFLDLQETMDQATSDYQEQILLSNQDKLLYSKEKQDTLARIIAGDHRYLPYSTRGTYLNRLFSEQIHKFDETLSPDEIELIMRALKHEVSKTFEEYFKKDVELGLSLKIRDMLEVGMPKNKIIAKLELTDGIYEKLKALI